MTRPEREQRSLRAFEEPDEGEPSDEDGPPYVCTLRGCDKEFRHEWERDNHSVWHESERSGGTIDGP